MLASKLPEQMEQDEIADMLEDEEGYVVPWAIQVHSNGDMWIRGDYTVEPRRNGPFVVRILEMSSPDGVIALRCKLTQAGFDVIHLVKLPRNKALGRIVPTATPAHTFAVGDRVEAACDITEGMLFANDETKVAIPTGTQGEVTALRAGGWLRFDFVLDDTPDWWSVNTAWLRPATANAPDAWVPEPREGGQVLADDITDMPTVWAHEHAVVVAERDALRDELARWKVARAGIVQRYNKATSASASYDWASPSRRAWLARANGFRDALALLPDGE